MRYTQIEYTEKEEYPLSKVSDYFALLKPRVMYLVVFTSLVGIFLAPGKISAFEFFANIFAIALGSGASGAFNMWYERDLDAKMARTSDRPIPLGVIGEADGLSFAVACAILSIMILFLSSNLVATLLLICAMLVYCGLYTIYLKRRSAQNIVIGGLSGALPPLIGWASVTGSISLEPLILVMIIFLWTPPHFWALSIKKMEEYQAAGIPMLPNVKGIIYTKLNILIYSIILVMVSFLPYYFSFANVFYFITALVLGARFIYLSALLYFNEDDSLPMKLFGFSILYLFCLFSGLLVAKVLSF